MREILKLLSILLVALTAACASNRSGGDPPIPEKNEIVMPPNATLKATTRTGDILITSGHGLKRSYSWDGQTRSVVMIPRPERWYGSLGIYFPGPGFHWKKTPDGIRRGVVQEGQQHFASQDEALQWIRRQDSWLPTVYRDDGLVVGFGKSPQRYQLNVDVWQVFIDGKKPASLPGSNNDAVSASWNERQPQPPAP